MEDKIDKLLNGQAKISTEIAVLQTRLDHQSDKIAKNEKDLEDLKKFKWGIIGTAAVSLSTFFKTMFA